MSRSKKSRSLKRVNGGVKTGTKERTKIERKRRKEMKKDANPRKLTRQKSVYQQFLDDNGIVDKSHSAKPVTNSAPQQPAAPKQAVVSEKPVRERVKSEQDNLWDMLENPNSTNTY